MPELRTISYCHYTDEQQIPVPEIFQSGNTSWKHLDREISFCSKTMYHYCQFKSFRLKDFELLLEVVEGMNFTNDIYLLYTIRQNIPDNYNLVKFSIEFIENFLSLGISFYSVRLQ